MTRASRIPYHQNVYDLLGIEPGESPEAARMIAEHEAQHGPLPASVKEWYLVPNVVLLSATDWRDSARREEGTLWHDYSNQDHPAPLAGVLAAFARERTTHPNEPIWVMCENQAVVNWLIEPTGSDDPPVWCDNDSQDRNDWKCVAPSFSDFTVGWFARYYLRPYTPVSRNGSDARFHGAKPLPKPHSNGLWLRSPDEPFQPPVIDFLTEHFGEPERTTRPHNVTTYTYRPLGGTIRVTADEPTLTGGLSAWWVHAHTPERLAEFAELLLPWGTLRDTLRADTNPAGAVLKRVRGA